MLLHVSQSRDIMLLHVSQSRDIMLLTRKSELRYVTAT